LVVAAGLPRAVDLARMHRAFTLGEGSLPALQSNNGLTIGQSDEQ